jgi:hypothetical protein
MRWSFKIGVLGDTLLREFFFDLMAWMLCHNDRSDDFYFQRGWMREIRKRFVLTWCFSLDRERTG